MKRLLNTVLRMVQKLHYRILIRSFSVYQPVYDNGRLLPIGDRSSVDRWEMIKKEIMNLKVQSLLDIGSAEGFYVIQAAREFGCLALGIEANSRRFNVAQSQIVFEKTMPAGFMLGSLDLALAEKLPQFDLVIFMSVMHHIMYRQGEDYCRELLQKLRAKIGQVMIFEMGQSNESLQTWSKQLPDMGENPHEWIKNFLLSAGFSRVTKIGESDSQKHDQKRAIFLVEP